MQRDIHPSPTLPIQMRTPTPTHKTTQTPSQKTTQPAPQKTPPWRKLLYVRQAYADNYVDETFLGEMRKNVSVKLYSYAWLVRNSLVVTQHLTGILIFISFFVFLYRGWISALQLVVLANTATLSGYLVWTVYVWHRGAQYRATGKQALKSAILFMMTLLGLTPILKTLTEDTSSDTIWALTATSLLINASFFDYAADDARTNDSIALNAAIFASVMLASRLPTKAHVFGLMSLAVDWFALFPLLRRSLRRNYSQCDLYITLLLASLAIAMLLAFSPLAAILYGLALLLSTFLLPAIYVYLQRYKNEIHGPWDEAALLRSDKKSLRPS